MDFPIASQLVLLSLILLTTILASFRLLGAQAPSTAEKTYASKPTKGPKTFRISGVPPNWDEERLRLFLADQDNIVGPVVESLAIDIDGRCRTGTATFQNVPKQLQNGRTWKILLPKTSETQSTSSRYLVIDNAFLGITPLYSPHPEYHKVDIIAIPGLGGHPFGSFKERDGNHMWLRDSLPNDLTHEDTTAPIARVMIYGYGSSVANSNNFQNLEDLSTSFYNSLLALARAPTAKPIIFVAHSLGGLIVKQALITLSKSKNEDDLKLVKATYGIVFFGVPHDGMDISSLIPMVRDGPNRFLIESISHVNSQILSIQQREFHAALGDQGDSEIFCFYETEKSPTAHKDENGDWSMLGPKACLVTKSSATHCRSWERGPEHTCAISRTHSEMVKFGPQDHEYHKARERLIGLARRAVVAQHGKQSADVKSSKYHWMVPFERNEGFVGREDILRLLLKRTPPSTQPDACQRTVIQGLGGVGKTQIALEAAYRLRDTDNSCSVFWVPAVDATTFENAYRDIGQQLGVAGLDDDKADIKALVQAAMNDEDAGRWLLIIDNADDPELMFGLGGLARYLPCSMKGSILFTTRTREVMERLDVHSAGVIKAAKMSQEEAREMMRTRLTETHMQDTASTDGLLDFLDHLPLAIRQASAYMHKTGISTVRYLEYCRSSDITLVKLLSRDFEDRGRYEGIKNPVATTWLISFEHISRDSPRAGEYLRFMCFLAERNIPVSLLPLADDELEVDEAVGMLEAYGFITRLEDGMSVEMHRLVRLAMWNWLRKEEQSQKTYNDVVQRLNKVFTFPKHENRQIWIRYMAHAQRVLESDEQCANEEEITGLLFNVAEALYIQGRYEKAARLYKETLELRKKVLGKEHPSTLDSMNNLALVLKSMGEYAEAKKMHQETLELREKVLGKEHLSTLDSMNNLALVLKSMGEYAEAEKIHRLEWKLTEKLLGKKHPSTLDSINNLALMLNRIGEYTEAKKMHQETLELREKVLGREHPSTLDSMNNLALVLDSIGEYAEAKKMHRETLELREKVLGKEHPSTLDSMNNLALMLNSMGEYAEAKRIYQKTLKLKEKVLGKEHPSTLNSMNNLALMLKSIGEYAEAEKIHQLEWKLTEKLLGREHPSTLDSMNNLALVLKSMGEYAEAKKMHQETLELREKVLGREHPSTLDSMNNLALMLKSIGEYTEAKKMHRETLELREKLLGREHPSTLDSMNNLALMLKSIGEYTEAKKMHRETLKLKEKILGKEHPSTLDSMNNLALMLNRMGENIEAEKMHRETLELREKVLGKEHPSTLISVNNLALMLKSMRGYTETEKMHQQMLQKASLPWL
ncbi:hypothetical protein FOFC_15320 [Fusarium oxysporum]|nr:hypothetical protein FOFC_15320 [Fusarium oxysporum]